MKLAFVAYPEATLLPPYHGSQGSSLYAIASVLSRSCEVVVYGMRDFQRGAEPGVYGGAEYRFIPSTASDRIRLKVRRHLSRWLGNRAPLSTSRWLYPAYADAVAADLQKTNWDLIHVQTCTQYVEVIRDFNPGAKIALHLHSALLSQSNPEELNKRLRKVDLLLTVSNYMSAKTSVDFPAVAGRCETAYNGIETWLFEREKDYSSPSNHSQVRLLYVGGVWPHKGVHVLLDAFNAIVAQFPQVRLDIVGPQGDYPIEENIDVKEQDLFRDLVALGRTSDVQLLKMKLGLASPDAGTYLTHLKSKLSAAARPKVFFHGYVSRSELIDFYYNSDIFIFPPIWDEAFGCTPLEAMAAGVPVVASRCGGIIETVKEGETGFLVQKNDSEGLVRAVETLIKDGSLREKMGRAGRLHVFESFTWEAISDSMYRRYQHLCGTTLSH